VKIARFELGGVVEHGIVEGDNIYTMVGDVFGEFEKGNRLCHLEDIKLLAPVEPATVICAGLNYVAHVAELGKHIPQEPALFFKPRTSVIGPLDSIVYPRISQQVRYEGELAVVIGRRAKGIAQKDVSRYIVGYTCSDDVTAMDIIEKDGRLTRAKSFDTFCPLGPVITTELDGNNLGIKSRLNGIAQQNGSTSDMIFNIEKLISYISQFMTLLPGDVILTGAPPGSSTIKPGDTIEIEIEGIGRLSNSVVASD